MGGPSNSRRTGMNIFSPSLFPNSFRRYPVAYHLVKASCYFPKGLTVSNAPGRDNLLVHLDYPVIKILLDYSVRKILLDYFVRKILLDSGFSYNFRLLFKAGSCCLPNHDPPTSLPFEQSAASHSEPPTSVSILLIEPYRRGRVHKRFHSQRFLAPHLSRPQNRDSRRRGDIPPESTPD